MRYRNWIKVLAVMLGVNILILGGTIYGKNKFDRAWDEYKSERSTFMAKCQSNNSDWSKCWEKFNSIESPSLKSAALKKAHPFTSENSNQFFGYALISFAGVAALIILSIFLQAARRFFQH